MSHGTDTKLRRDGLLFHKVEDNIQYRNATMKNFKLESEIELSLEMFLKCV